MNKTTQLIVGLLFTVGMPITGYFFGLFKEEKTKLEGKIDGYMSYSKHTDSIILCKIDELKDTVRKNNEVVKSHIKQNNEDFRTVVSCISYMANRIDKKNNEVIDLLLKEVSFYNKSNIRYLDKQDTNHYNTEIVKCFYQQNK